MGLVADDQVKVAYGEQFPFPIFHRVDAVHHGLVGGKDAVGGVVVFLLAQVGHREIRQQVHKAALGLGDQRVAVSQEEDIFHPAVLEEYLHQSDDRAGLTGAGGHDQQGLPAVLGQRLTGGFDCPLLVVAACNVVVLLDVLEAGPHGPEVEEFLQVPLGVEGRHPALRAGPVVQAGVKAVGEEYHRAAAIFLFQNLGVLPGLLAALGQVYAGTLGLDDGQGTVGIVVEHIVGIAHPALVGHTGQFHLIEPVLPIGPARIGEHGVDIQLAGLVLGEIQRLRGVAGLLGLPAGGEFCPESLVFRHEGGQIHLGRRNGSRSDGLPLQQGRVKFSGRISRAVAAGDKVHKVPEVFQAQPGLLPSDLLPGGGGGVARLANVFKALPQVPVHDGPKVLGVHQAGEPVVVGHDQPTVHGVHPFDGKLHAPAAV